MNKTKFVLRILTVVLVALGISNIVTADEKPEIFVQLGHLDSVDAVAFSHDGRYVISEASTHKGLVSLVKIWDSSTGKEIRTVNTRYSSHFVSMSQDNKYALVSSGKVWDIWTGKEIRTISLLERGREMIWAAFSPDGENISVLSDETLAARLSSRNFLATLDIWNISSGIKIKTIKGFIPTDNAASTNRYFFKKFKDCWVIYDATTGEPARRLKISQYAPLEDSDHDPWSSFLDFSDDCLYAVLGKDEHTIVLRDFNKGTRSVKKITERLRKVYISHNGEYFGALLSSTSVPHSNEKFAFRVWRFDDGKKIGNLILRKKQGPRCVAPSPDLRHVVAGFKDGSVKILDIATGKEIRTFVAEQDYQEYMPKYFDRYLVTYTGKGCVIWDIHTGTILKKANEKMPWEKMISSYVTKKSLNKEGKWLIYSCDWSATSLNQNYNATLLDGTVKLFDSKTGKEIAQFASFTDGEWIVITPEGYYNASPNGAKHLNVRIGTNVYGIEMYSKNMFRPDLVKAALAKVWVENE